MKYILKGEVPKCLKSFINKNGANFNKFNSDYEIKKKLKEILLSEQGKVCCYCGQAIKIDECVLEHIKPKEHYPKLALEYKNLACSCRGGQDKRQNKDSYPLYCDAKKHDKEIKVLPTDENCEERFIFDDEGNIFAADENDVDAKETIEILGLNTAPLVNKRKEAINFYKYLDGDVDWNQEIEQLMQKDTNGAFQAFYFILIYYIKNYKIFETSNNLLQYV